MDLHFQGDYVCVIHERKFVKSGENVFKVYGSSHAGNTPHFPKRCRVILAMKVQNAFALIVEESIVNTLVKNKEFVQREDIGYGYFQGNKKNLIDIIMYDVCANIDWSSNINICGSTIGDCPWQSKGRSNAPARPIYGHM